MSKPRRPHISRKVHYKVGSGGGRLGLTSEPADRQTGRTLGVTERTKERRYIKNLHAAEVRGLSDANRRALVSLDGKEEEWEDSTMGGLLDLGDVGDGDQTNDSQPNDQTFVHELGEMLSGGIGRGYSTRRRVDHRTRAQRLQRLESAWSSQMESLTAALLDYRLKSSNAQPPSQMPIPAPEGIDFPVIDLYTRKETDRVNFEGHAYPGVALVHAGYMPTSPTNPQFGISIDTLSLYHLLRLRQPSFSIQAFSKVLCDRYRLPYRRSYRDMLSRSFEIYIRLSNIIDAQVQKACGRDAPNWRAKHACPPCSYTLEDEPPLEYDRIVAMDGNNSLKRCNRAAADTRVYEDNDYYLSQSQVDRFAHEVKAGEKRQDEASTETPATEEGDPADGDKEVGTSPCASRWKAASADSVKRMWDLFDETGVFASACRHGLMLWVTDMVKSGEL